MTRWEEACFVEFHSQWPEHEDTDPRDANITAVGWWLLGLVADVKGWLLAHVCRWRDHDWECDDWGGPDSGGMAGHCNRCGFSFSHTMY